MEPVAKKRKVQKATDLVLPYEAMTFLEAEFPAVLISEIMEYVDTHKCRWCERFFPCCGFQKVRDSWCGQCDCMSAGGWDWDNPGKRILVYTCPTCEELEVDYT